MTSRQRALLVLALGVAGCGDGGTDPSPGGNNGGNTGGTCTSTSASVTVNNNSFSPSCTRVAAGSTVTWTWSATAVDHNVTFQSGTSSPTQSSGTFQRGFPTAGTFTYRCTIHAAMTGEIRAE
jgi:plastocyanin